MGVVGRLAYKLPSVKALQAEGARLADQREALRREIAELSAQRDGLEGERDELAGHCRRLNGELVESLERERRLRAERAEILGDRDSLEGERNELRGHCARLESDLSEERRNQELLLQQIESLRAMHEEFAERARAVMGTEPLLRLMQNEWDERARLNALHFTNNEREEWNDADYDATGEENVRGHICSDMQNICQGLDPARMRVLEIGCGAGRMTKALAGIFGEVHGVDISAEMIRIARARLAGRPNIFLHQNNGMDLRHLASESFDFALSFIVFQHIPSQDVIESYVKEVHRVLKPGRLFKFQAQGGQLQDAPPLSTWYGAGYTREGAQALAARNGFECRYAHGDRTQEFWLWFFKRPQG